MYTTIEPRLIALLNTEIPSEPYAAPSSLFLPPPRDHKVLSPSGRPVLLEPDASERGGSVQHTALAGAIDKEEDFHQATGRLKLGSAAIGIDRTLGKSSPQSLRKILDASHDGTLVQSKTRQTVESTSKDDFVQLPQPPKQKATKQVVPPIIIGLFEPPPQAALFPPIASSSFHDSHGRNSLNTISQKIGASPQRSGDDSSWDSERGKSTKSKGNKSGRTKKRWTEEETNNLLLGVHKHGVGNWTEILEDSTFAFNERSGSDLKDRFRTCCPAELRGKKSESIATSQFEPKAISMTGKISNNICADESGPTAMPGTDSPSGRAPKGRSHRKRLEDLALLGIKEPFRKSIRRERRPFSEEEDREILEGYKIHGPAWTRIQRDSRFHLQTRQPLDLRDRFRNKYPEKFRGDEKSKETLWTINSDNPNGSEISDLQENDQLSVATCTSTIQPQSIQPTGQDIEAYIPKKGNSEGAASIQPSSSREALRIPEIISPEIPSVQPLNSPANPKDNFNFPQQTNMEHTDGIAYSQPFDWGGTIAASEMDISRFLLEPWPEISHGKDKQNFTDINSILSSSTEANSHNYYQMLGEADQLVDLQDDPFE